MVLERGRVEGGEGILVALLLVLLDLDLDRLGAAAAVPRRQRILVEVELAGTLRDTARCHGEVVSGNDAEVIRGERVS